jgi:hypothetical protein
MKNILLIRLCFVVFLAFCLYSSVLFAGGKLRIVQPIQPEYKPSATLVFKPLSPELPPPTQTNQQPNIATDESDDEIEEIEEIIEEIGKIEEIEAEQKEKNDSITIAKKIAVNSIVDGNDRAQVNLPQPQKTINTTKLLRNGETRGIIAWNGKTDDNGEEIMIIESTEISATKTNEASISIIPLPGKPISVNRLNKSIFNPMKTTLRKKIPASGRATPEQPIIYPEIASFTVLVLDVKNIDSFTADVNYYIQKYYDCAIRVIFLPDELNVIKKYWDQGFRYFALDIAPLLTRPTNKQPLIFHFKSKCVYYPLAINSIGRTGRGTIDLFVITPDMIKLGGAFEQGKEESKLRLMGNKTVDLSLTELRELESQLAKIFESNEEKPVKLRNFWIVFDAPNMFTKDFTAFTIESNKDTPEQPISEIQTTPAPESPETSTDNSNIPNT